MATTSDTAPGIDPDRPYSYEAIAAYFNDPDIDARRVRRWVEDGHISYVQLPKGRRVLGRHLLAWLNKNSVEVE